MTKEQEIGTLKALKGDTYFAEYFCEDIDKMCENIKNDYPIELDCTFTENCRKLFEKVKVLAEKMAGEDILDDDTSETYGQLAAIIGTKGIIKAKMDAGVELTQSEVQWLCREAGI